jgi:hypothetical protein
MWLATPAVCLISLYQSSKTLGFKLNVPGLLAHLDG